jgi:hypothetical protein
MTTPTLVGKRGWHRLTVYVQPDLRNWLKDEAQRSNRSVSNLVETVLQELRDQGVPND